MTNYENAINILKTAKTVEEWNKLRDELKATLTTAELSKIDGSGLIVEVLKSHN